MTAVEQEKLVSFFKTMPNTQELWYLDCIINTPWTSEFFLIKVMAFSKDKRRSNNEIYVAYLESGRMIWLDDANINDFKIVTNFVN